MVAVTLWSGLVPLADNQRKLEIEAGTIRELLGKLQDRYPGLNRSESGSWPCWASFGRWTI